HNYHSQNDDLFNQVSAQTGFVDLEGFEIGSISVPIDSISIKPDVNDNTKTSVVFSGRVFYELE
ncbi:MAG: hypothetical protein WCH04_17845, partial [Gammaproteobacteria bacterium]